MLMLKAFGARGHGNAIECFDVRFDDAFRHVNELFLNLINGIQPAST